MTEQRINAADNPELANKLIQQVLAEGSTPAPQSAPVADYLPGDPKVRLPFGYRTEEGEWIHEAEIVELNGFAEEALARPMPDGRRYAAILEHTVDKIGGKEVTREMLQRLSAGDRNLLLLAVRQLSYGPVKLVEYPCEHCGELVDHEIDLLKDVPVKEPSEEDRSWTVKLSKGAAVLRALDGAGQVALQDAGDKNGAELLTMALKETVDSINDWPVTGVDDLRRLTARDRRALNESLEAHSHGPMLDETRKACPNCGEVNLLPLTMSGLF